MFLLCRRAILVYRSYVIAYERLLNIAVRLNAGSASVRSTKLRGLCFLADYNVDLLGCTNPPNDNGLPSWIPDWGYPAAGMPVGKRLLSRSEMAVEAY
jgi:hypothetical protein